MLLFIGTNKIFDIIIPGAGNGDDVTIIVSDFRKILLHLR